MSHKVSGSTRVSIRPTGYENSKSALGLELPTGKCLKLGSKSEEMRVSEIDMLFFLQRFQLNGFTFLWHGSLMVINAVC